LAQDIVRPLNLTLFHQN